MPYNVSVILPDNLTSGYLQSEFINSGQTYTNNSYSKDPNLDNNRNTLIFGFEVRDSASRQIVNPRRIKVLYLSNDKEFDRFIRAFDWPSFTYEESLSNAVRQNRTDLVFTANEAPPSVSIFLHHEMAQTPMYPSKLFFFCEQASESGGATPICRSDILLEHLNQEIPEFVESCESLGLRYSQTMPAENDLASGQGLYNLK